MSESLIAALTAWGGLGARRRAGPDASGVVPEGGPVYDSPMLPAPCYVIADAHLGVAPAERAELHRRIEARFRLMLEQGLLDEVRRLHARGDLHPGLPSVRSAGYRQAWEYLEGRMAYGEMVERAIMATRQLAKRQLTWMRSWTELDRISVDQEKPGGLASGEYLLHEALKRLARARI